MGNTVYCDLSDLEELTKSARGILSDGTIRREMAGALNDTLPHIAAETKRRVSSEYLITKSINKTLSKKRATSSDLTAEARYTDKPLPLFVFKHTAPKTGTRSPVSIARLAGEKKVLSYSSEGAAIFKAYGSKKIIRRASRQRNLKSTYTVSIPQMVANDDIYKEIAKDAESFVYKKLKYRLERRMSKL